MKLSDGEKLILAMISEIHVHLNIPGGMDSSFLRSALSDGNLWALERRFPRILRDDEPDAKVVAEVEDLLEMWALIEGSYGKLPVAQQAQVDVEANLRASPRFDGFDDHNHAAHLQVAECLINGLGRFPEFKGRELNSHRAATLVVYRRMLAIFRATVCLADLDRPLNAEELATILKGRAMTAEAEG